MAVLKDIAEAAGVSIRTVNRVLKGSGYVSVECRRKVQETIDQLGYLPNKAARSLKMQRSFEIVVIMGALDELATAKLAAFEAQLRATEFDPTVMFRDTKSRIARDMVRQIVERRPAAVAFFRGGSSPKPAEIKACTIHGIPYVVFDSYTSSIDTVRIDRCQGVCEAVHYLADQGRRNIAYVGNKRDRTRIDGYCAAVDALGRSPLFVTVKSGLGQYEAGIEAVAQILTSRPRPDAVQVYSDEMAMGVLAGLHDAGLRIPEDIAVVGFDNRAFAAFAAPPLTTVAQPNEAVGRAAAAMLLAKIAGKPPPDSGWSVTLPTTMVLRASA